jgi:hypothetical protein
LALDYTAEADPLAWTLDKIKNRLPAMLMRCEVENIARGMDQRDIDAALLKIAAWAETNTISSLRVKRHLPFANGEMAWQS